MIIARTWKRILAYFLDLLVLSFCWLPVKFFMWQPVVNYADARIPINILFLSGALILFYKWMFLYFLGGTPGKLFLGLRIVNRWDESRPLGLLQSLLRVLADALSLFFGLAPRAFALLRFDRTHFSDWIAETQVVQKMQHRAIKRRWWLPALVIIYISAPLHFMRIYHLAENLKFESGHIVIAPDFWGD